MEEFVRLNFRDTQRHQREREINGGKIYTRGRIRIRDVTGMLLFFTQGNIKGRSKNCKKGEFSTAVRIVRHLLFYFDCSSSSKLEKKHNKLSHSGGTKHISLYVINWCTYYYNFCLERHHNNDITNDGDIYL